MDDLTITALCAAAMGVPLMGSNVPLWNPLHDDSQAMALVKKFPMTIEHPSLTVSGKEWHVESVEIVNGICPDIYSADLNRAICECVAKLKQGER